MLCFPLIWKIKSVQRLKYLIEKINLTLFYSILIIRRDSPLYAYQQGWLNPVFIDLVLTV